MHIKFHSNWLTNLVFIWIWNFWLATILNQEGGWSWPMNTVEICIRLVRISSIIEIGSQLQMLFNLNLKFLKCRHFETWWLMKLTNKLSWDLNQTCLYTKYDWNQFIIMGENFVIIYVIIMGAILFEFEILKQDGRRSWQMNLAEICIRPVHKPNFI